MGASFFESFNVGDEVFIGVVNLGFLKSTSGHVLDMCWNDSDFVVLLQSDETRRWRTGVGDVNGVNAWTFVDLDEESEMVTLMEMEMTSFLRILKQVDFLSGYVFEGDRLGVGSDCIVELSMVQ